jgi:hypothetical protein
VDIHGLILYRVEELLITELRQLATTQNVHVTVVSHLRKEKEGEYTLNSITGSARQVQEANNVLIIQNQQQGVEHGSDKPRMRRYLQILKNRHNGKLALEGDIELAFDRDTRSPRLKDTKAVKKYTFNK